MAVVFKQAQPIVPKPQSPEAKRDADIAALMQSSGLPRYMCDNLLYPSDQKYLARTITTGLLTKEQEAWLDEEEISVQDIITGNFTYGESVKIRQFMLEWNKKLGRELFHF